MDPYAILDWRPDIGGPTLAARHWRLDKPSSTILPYTWSVAQWRYLSYPGEAATPGLEIGLPLAMTSMSNHSSNPTPPFCKYAQDITSLLHPFYKTVGCIVLINIELQVGACNIRTSLKNKNELFGYIL